MQHVPKRSISATLTVVLDGPDESGRFSMRCVAVGPEATHLSASANDLASTEAVYIASGFLEEVISRYLRSEQRANNADVV